MSFLRKELMGWIAFGLIAAGFLYFASRDITLPGLWRDEAMQASLGMQAALKLPPLDYSALAFRLASASLSRGLFQLVRDLARELS